MSKFQIKAIHENPLLLNRAAQWFHQKWKIPEEAYLESMQESLNQSSPVPAWYVATENDVIIAGLGVIENDFHNRKDLSPNVCAVYVEELCRNRGIAGQMLNYVCEEMASKGVNTLYLLTDHTAFYERYGWEFFCMAQGDGEETMSRMYIHKQDTMHAED